MHPLVGVCAACEHLDAVAKADEGCGCQTYLLDIDRWLWLRIINLLSIFGLLSNRSKCRGRGTVLGGARGGGFSVVLRAGFVILAGWQVLNIHHEGDLIRLLRLSRGSFVWLIHMNQG